MKYSFGLAALALKAAAFPAVLEAVQQEQALEKRVGLPSLQAARDISAGRTNCGPLPCFGWDPKAQFVSTYGDHAYAAPAEDEIRGPCPGLNAAANHGYLSRSGVVTIQETITGLTAAYGLGPIACAVLAAYAVIYDGDPVLGTWSIGGPPSSDPLTKGILGQARGLSYSHNNYEGDASIGRNDAYLNNGDAHSLNVTRFASAYAATAAGQSDRYTLDSFAQNFALKVQESIENNPLYFSAPFATFVVSPAAFNFVINLMSNHSQEEQSGYFNGEMFKTFFAVEGEYPNFKWLPGQERIPDNWYRRPAPFFYELKDIGGDVAIQYLAYPDSARIGGNVNGVNTYAGIDLGDLTGGIYNTTSVLNPNGHNLACFIAQLTTSLVPHTLDVALSELSAITNILNEFVAPVIGNLSCAPINKYDQTAFNQFAGYHYSPTGPATNY
jgi:hypothetical protein